MNKEIICPFCNNEPDEDLEVFFDYDGGKVINEEMALAVLLKEEVLFSNTGSDKTIVLYVNCNDVFMWGCADAEDITTDQIESLYNLHFENKKWGTMKWACINRNLQPQSPIVRDMKIDKYWDDILEGLRPNE